LVKDRTVTEVTTAQAEGAESDTSEVVALRLQNLALEAALRASEARLRRAEQDQRALRDQLARVGASVPGVVCSWLVHPDGTMSMPYTTPHVIDLFGLTQEELARDLSAWEYRVHPDDLGPLRDNLASCGLALSRRHDLYRYFHPTRGMRWIEGWSSPLRLADGSLDWHGFLMDVTERHDAEEAVRAGLERYHSLFENMTSGCAHGRVVFVNGSAVDWEYVAVNAAWQQMMGVGDVRGKRASAVVPGIHASNPELLLTLERVARTARPARFEIHVAQLDRWFTVGAYRPALDEFVVVLDDITHLRRAEEQLRDSEARFRAIFEQAGVGVAQIETRTGRFVLVNQHWCNLLGYSADELRGAAGPELTHRDDRAAEAADTAELLAGEVRGFSRERRYLSSDGSTVWVHLTLSRLWGAGEAPTHHVAVIEDITARKRTEAALLDTQDELRALMADLEQRVLDRTAELARAARAKDEFLASMSHELRTPLNGILGLSEALVEGVYGPFEGRQATALGRIQESGRHLLALINDILDLAKVEAGKIELELERVSLPDLCAESLRVVLEPARRKRIGTTVTLSPGLPTLVADARRLKQVLVNLLGNAVKFTPEGGAIGIEAARTEGGAGLRLTVWDTGIGIAPKDQARLFQPFVQLDGRLSRQYAGTGLGLSLVRRLVELHGGEVRVVSELGSGSRFTVTLPTQAQATPAPAPPPPVMGRSLTPPLGLSAARTVLVADDDGTNLALMRDVLEHAGYQVTEARDGHEAVARALALRPAVILMDLQMPLLDGLGAIRAIRALPSIAATPIVAVTALAMPGDEARCLAAGADEYLTKPVPVPRLLAVVGGIVGKVGS
jgi:PAS domain S-box-containing protein